MNNDTTRPAPDSPEQFSEGNEGADDFNLTAPERENAAPKRPAKPAKPLPMQQSLDLN